MLYQVNNLFSRRILFKSLSRFIHNDSITLHPLKNRKIIKVDGEDAHTFLQGLITNDMRHFDQGAKSMYTMFLNYKGRVLFDTLVHKWEGNRSFLIECDEKAITHLKSHLKSYKLRRKVEIQDFSQNIHIWALTPEDVVDKNLLDLDVDVNRKLNIFKDPRLPALGYRVITSETLDNSDIVKYFGDNITVEDTDYKYKYWRYKLGVSEGVDDLSPGICFPLEVNCDYLHGVSFYKGCYIGQELTARTHHTGVVRKRIMPIQFDKVVDDDLAQDSLISDSYNAKSNLGKLKGYISDCGIGLLRIKETLNAQELKVGDYTLKTWKPYWWPIEAPKEKVKLD